MPGNDDQFKIIIDDSALDKTIEKGKKTAAELTSQFQKASESLKAALAKAFAPDQFKSYLDQIQAKINSLQGGLNVKTALSIDSSQVTVAANSIKALESQVASLQHTARQTASVLEDSITNAVKKVSQQIRNLHEEQKKIQTTMYKSEHAPAGITVDPSRGQALQIQHAAIAKDQQQAQSLLNTLLKTFRDAEHVQGAINGLVVKLNQSEGVMPAIARAISRRPTSGRMLDLPRDEVAKDLQSYALWIQEQTGKLESSISSSMENLEAQVHSRLRSLPEITSDMPRKQARQVGQLKKEYSALLDEVAGLKSRKGTPHDILGAFEGPDIHKILEKALMGDANWDTEIASLNAKAVKYDAKLHELTAKYAHLMEKLPAHVKTSAGYLIPGTAQASSIAVTKEAFPKEMATLEKELAKLTAIKDKSEKVIQEIKSKEGQLAYFQRGGQITRVPPLEEGYDPNVGPTRHGYTTQDFHQRTAATVEEHERLQESLAGLAEKYHITWSSQEELERGLEAVGVAIKDPTRDIKTLRDAFDSAHSPVNAFRKLLTGVRQDADEMPSATEKMRAVRNVFREPILQPGVQTFEFAEKLKGSVGNATGYVKREIADTTAKAGESLFKFKQIVTAMGEDVTKPFQPLINQIVGFKDVTGKTQGFGPQFRIGEQTKLGENIPYLKAFEDRIARIQGLMLTLDTKPTETLPKLEKEVISLSTSLGGVGKHFTDVNVKASEMSSSFRVQPLINELRTLFTHPDLSAHQLIQAQSVVGQLNTKFGEMVKYAPQLEPLRKQFKGLADDFISSKAFTIPDPKSKTPVFVDQTAVKSAYNQFAIGLEPLAKQLNFTQVISDALMGLARLARGAGDVGHNASAMSDQITKMIGLLHTASTKGLTAVDADALRKMATDMDQYTVKLNSSHLPIVKTLNSEYRKFNDTVDTVVGKMLKTTERGALPEIIRDRFAPPKMDQPMPIENWIEKMIGGERVFKQIGEKFNKQWIEIFKPPGQGVGKPLTVADMFGTGRLELIEQAVTKTQSYGRAIDFVSHKLGESGQFENFYQPIMKSAEALKILIQRLRETALASANVSPRMASVVLSLDTTQAALGHTTNSFSFMKQAVDKLNKTGGEATPEWTSKVQAGLQGITKASATALTRSTSSFQDRLSGIISGESSSPAQIYSALKEAMKLPMAMGKEPIAAKGIGEMLFGGGGKSLVSAIPFDRLMQVKGALGEYTTEIVESGFGFKSIQRAQFAVGRLFNEINKEINVRQHAALATTGKPLSTTISESLIPSRWDQETPKLAVQMKGAMKGIFEGIEQASPGTFPDQSRLIDRASKWSESQIEIKMKSLKRRVAQLNQEFAKEAVPSDIDLTPSMSKMLVKGINWEHALDALERAKQNAITSARKQALKTTTVVGAPEAMADVAKGEDLALIKEPLAGAKKAVVGSIDEMTQAKVAALQRQIQQMKGKGPELKSALKLIEQEAVEGIQGIAGKEGSGGIVARLFGGGGGGEKEAISRRLSNLASPFVTLSNQLETVGYAVGSQGQPLALMGELIRAARQEIMGLIRELSKTGVSTNYLDQQVAKFNATAADDKKVMTFALLQEQMLTLKQVFASTMADYASIIQAGGVGGTEAVAKQKELANVYKQLNNVAQEYERSITAARTPELLIEDLHRREIATIRELGVAYQEATLAAKSGVGPLVAQGQVDLAKTTFAGRGMAAQTLISAAYKTIGTTPEFESSALPGQKFGGLFSTIGSPAATIDDLKNKLLASGQPGQMIMLGPQIKNVLEVFREMNASFGLGVQEPKNLDALPAKFDKVYSAIEKNQKVLPTWMKAFEKGLGDTQGFIRQVLEKFDAAAVASGAEQWGTKYVEKVQTARDNLKNLTREAELYIRSVQGIEKTPQTQQQRIFAAEAGGELRERFGASMYAAGLDKDIPRAEMEKAKNVAVELKAATQGNLSIWERITNTVKTTRNNFADLFMYQVRWYTSMMIFWGVFNKVGETFKVLIDTQHQIQRAVRSMRDESGELVTHYERLEKLATIHIFDNMIKWATDAKAAGEALYQLASAGLNVTESLAALGPVMGLVRATEADTQETVKIVAGVYNVLSDSIEQNISVSTKFKIITDVMAKVFNDHQVELNELNQGYRFAISSADMAGLSFYELSAMLGVLNDNMIKGMRAGRGLQQVLVHISKAPYDIAASFIELAKHMNVPAEAFAKLASPAIKQMSVMELLREMSKIAQASGKSMEGLGRIMEQFDMIGGRTLAPLLMNFDKVDKTTKGLIYNSLGATEEMAGRMSTTMAANLRRIASYFTASMYPAITATHSALAMLVKGIAGAASAIEKMQSSVITGGFGSIGVPGAGLAVDTFIKSATWLATLIILSAQLGTRFDLVGKAAGWFAGVAETSFTRLGIVFLNIANSGPAIISFFNSIKTHAIAAGNAMRAALTVEGVGLAWSSFSSVAVAAWARIGREISHVNMSIQVIGLWPTILAGVQAAFIGIGNALGWVAMIASRHPLLFTIGLISAAVAGLTYYFKVWRQNYDDLVVAAQESNTQYMESLGKLEQKSIQAFHAITEAQRGSTKFTSLTEGLEGSKAATDEQKQAFDDYLRAVGISEYSTRILGVTVGYLKDKLEELSPQIKSNEAALRGHFNAIISNKEVTDKYTESLGKHIEVMKVANREAREAQNKQKTSLTDWIPDIFIALSPEWAKKRKDQWKKERDAETAEAIDNAALINQQISEQMRGRVVSSVSSPFRSIVEAWKTEGKDENFMKDALQKMLVPVAGADLSEWQPQIKGLDFRKLMKNVVPDEKQLLTIIKEPEALKQAVGLQWAAAIEKIDLNTVMGRIKAKQMTVYGLMQAMSKDFIKQTLDVTGVTIGEEALKKHQDARDKANESLLRAQMNFDKDYNAFLLRSKEAKVASMTSGYSAEIFATESFQMESKRLQDEYIRTQEEYKLKADTLARKHSELGREQIAAEESALSIERGRALLKIQMEQFELAKKMGEVTSKAWQEGAGEQMKYEYTLKNLKARELEAQAAEKLARVEKEIGANVKASSQEAQAAHNLRMEAYRLEAEAKKKELEYTMVTEKLKWETLATTSKLELERNAAEADPKKKFSPAAVEFFQRQIETANRMAAHATGMYQAQVSYSDFELRRKQEADITRNQEEQFKIQLHNLKTALQNGATSIAEFQKQHSQGIFGTSTSLTAPITGQLTSTFNDPRTGRRHLGGDIAAPAGTPFFAPTDMTIQNTSATMSNSPGGMVWGIDVNGVWHKFHHVVPGVQEKQKVRQGEQIGVLSNLGKGSHLDYKMQGPGGEYIDWMTQLGLQKGARIGKGGAVPLTIPVKPDLSVTQGDALQEFSSLVTMMQGMLKTQGEKAQVKIKPAITEFFNILKDMQFEPGMVEKYKGFFDQLAELWRAAGLNMKHFYQLQLDPYKKQFESGKVLEVPVLIKYVQAARAAGESDEQIRKRIFEADRVAFETEGNWTKDKFQGLMDFISQGALATGISGKKLFSSLFTEVFSPSKLQIMIDSDIDLMDMFYDQLAKLGKDLTGGGVPVKIMKSFETAIKGIISSGEELDENKYAKLVSTLSKIPSINLKEAADSIEKYWQAISNTRAFNVQDIGKMQNDMMRFGATQDEVWKAIGEVADVQIRRMYASWDKGAQGMKSDMSGLKELGEAFWWGMTKGVADFASKLKDPIRRLADSVTQTLTNMQSTLESVISDTLKKDFKGWQEYATKLGEGLINTASKNMSEMIMQSLTGLIGKALGIPEPKKPGTFTQAEAEAAGKGPAEQQMRFNTEGIKLNTEGIKTETKRTADGVEKLVQLAEQKETSKQPERETSKQSETAPEKTAESSGGYSPGTGGTERSTPSEEAGSSTTKSPYDWLSERTKAPVTAEEFASRYGQTESISVDRTSSEASTAPEEEPKSFWQRLWEGSPMQFAAGGVVPGSGSLDSVPALLTPGEVVLSHYHLGGLISLAKKFAEGGEVENPLQGLLGGIGDMVQGMLSPIMKMMNPRQQQIAQIGEGNYGGTFEQQAMFEQQFEQKRDMYRQMDRQKYEQQLQQQYQQDMQDKGLLGTMFSAGLGGLGGLFNLGGYVVQRLASGGPILQQNINPALWRTTVGPTGVPLSQWHSNALKKTDPWWKRQLPWLFSLLPLLMMLKGGKSGSSSAAADVQGVQDKFNALPDFTPEGLPTKAMFDKDMPSAGNMFGIPHEQFQAFGKRMAKAGLLGTAGGKLSLSSLLSTGEYSPAKFTPLYKSTDVSRIPPDIERELYGGPAEFASGGPVVQSRSASETSWQNMGSSQTVWEGPKPTLWNSIKPLFMMILPLLLAAQKKKAGGGAGADADVARLQKEFSALKDPKLDTSMPSFTKPLEGVDLTKGIGLDKSLLDTSGMKDQLASISKAPGESGGFLSSLINAPMNLLSQAWGGIKSIGSSIWGGLSSLGGLFGFQDGGLIPGLGMFGSILKPLMGGVFSIFGNMGKGIGGIGKGLFSGLGGLFGFQEGGFVDSLLGMISPSPAYAMELQDVLPQFSKTWDAKIAAGDEKFKQYAVDAKGGIEDVVGYFQKNNPNVMTQVAQVVGTTPEFTGAGNRVEGHGGHYNPFTDIIDLDLKQPWADPSKVRSEYSNMLTHEVTHSLQKSGRPLADWVPQVDQKVVSEFLQKQGLTDPKQLEYLSDPYETMARGVSHHLTKAISGSYDGNISWPPEYDKMFQDLAQGMTAGKYPQAPNQGLLKDFMWSVFGKKFQAGGSIPGVGGTDTVPAMLTPGEFVVNKGTVGLFGPDFFHALQDLAKTRGAAATPEAVLAGARSTLRFAAGGAVPRLPSVATTPTENKITVATVMDEESVGQFLNTKKYGEVLVNKLGSGITRRLMGGQGI